MRPLSRQIRAERVDCCWFHGSVFADPMIFVRQGDSPRGIMYTERKSKARKNNFHVAVSAALAEEFPTLPQLLRGIAEAPSSCLHVYLSEKQLCKFVKKSTKKRPEMVQRRVFQRACVHWCVQGGLGGFDVACWSPTFTTIATHFRPAIILRIDGSVGGVCPGCPQGPRGAQI